MKIILANYRYFISGGPERYMFNVIERLSNNNHKVIPFSIHYNQNLQTQYAKYFVEPLGNRDEVYFNKQEITPKIFLSTLSRLFYSKEVENAIIRLASDTKPQIAYVLHYLRKLSPSLLVGLKKTNIPIIVRLSDYAMVCPQVHCLRGDTPCTLCVKGNIIPSITFRCVKNSLVASSFSALATWFHRFKRYFELVDSFITTNQFMNQIMISAGFPEEKLFCIPTFTNINTFMPSRNFTKSNYIVYVGRLTHEKGVHVLIDAFNILQKKGLAIDIHLKITGVGFNKYFQNLKEKVKSKGLESNVHFLGNLETHRVSNLLNQALFSVVPSLWYENLPNSILESYACGTPVIASDLGSLSACVKNGVTGFHFRPGEPEDLAEKIEYCLNNPAILQDMAVNCRREALSLYSPKSHCESLINLFNKFI